MIDESDYGLSNYQWQKNGIGGQIKTKSNDFLVDEIDATSGIPVSSFEVSSSEENGLFLTGVAWKKGIDHVKLVNYISKLFRVDEKDISTAGIKDSNAETYQLFSVFQPQQIPSDPIQPTSHIEFSKFHYRREKVYPGNSAGNNFEIIIRNYAKPSNDYMNEFQKIVEAGIVNYYGYQRFGGTRPISAKIGRYILNNDYENIVNAFLGYKSTSSDEIYRKMWRDTRDPELLLKEWYNIPLLEKLLLKYLIKQKTINKSVIQIFPIFLQNIFKSAFISFLTNQYLSQRYQLDQLLAGEREIENNIEIALPSNKWIKPLNHIWKDVFEINSLKFHELKAIRHTSRFLWVYPMFWNHIINDDTMQLNFRLPPGSYATTILRELMKSPIINYF